MHYEVGGKQIKMVYSLYIHAPLFPIFVPWFLICDLMFVIPPIFMFSPKRIVFTIPEFLAFLIIIGPATIQFSSPTQGFQC